MVPSAFFSLPHTLPPAAHLPPPTHPTRRPAQVAICQQSIAEPPARHLQTPDPGHLRHVRTRKRTRSKAARSLFIVVAVARAHSPARHGSHRSIMSSPDQATEKKDVVAPDATLPAGAPEAPAAPAEKEGAKEAQPGDAGEDTKGKLCYGTPRLIFNSRYAVPSQSRHASTNRPARPQTRPPYAPLSFPTHHVSSRNANAGVDACRHRASCNRETCRGS